MLGYKLPLISSYTEQESDYKARKIFLENLYIKHLKNLTILRVFNTYGHYQFSNMPGSLVANIFDCFLQNKPLKL